MSVSALRPRTGAPRASSVAVLALALAGVVLAAAAPAWAAGPALVSDINPGASGSNPGEFTTVHGTLFFAADDGTHGFELWKTDGTTGGTAMVKDINPGGDSTPTELVNVNGTLFFRADDGAHGSELWKSDGTAAGTTMVKDINSGSAGSTPLHLTTVGGTLFFSADDGVAGRELWRSDGTAAGTTMVKDINPGATSNPTDLVNAGGTLFFHADDGVHGDELWRSDGTAAGTALVKDINPGGGSSNISEPTDVNGTLFFSAFDGNAFGLWKSDGTPAGTTLVKFVGSVPEDLTNVGGTLFFSADDGNNGRELWKSDGTDTGTVLVKDINPGAAASEPAALTDFNGTLFFQANDGTSGVELWKSDGTAAGTVLVKDINPAGDSFPDGFTSFEGQLYFSAFDGADGREVWKTDGTGAGTTLVADINPGPGSSIPGEFTDLNGTLLFGADDGTHGAELWKLVGTGTPTSTVVNCTPMSVMTGVATSCSATASNAAAGGTDPTGAVTFSTDSAGSFESGGVCTLSSTGNGGLTECSVHYIPSSVGSGTHTVTAEYGGDASHDASSGTARVTVSSTGGGGGTGAGTGGGGSAGGSGIVIARFGSVGRAQTLAHSLLLNGGASSTTSGGIADYTWIVGSPGQPAAVDPCGPSPLVAMSFQRAGIQDVTLQVTTTSGQTSQTTQRLNVPAVATNQWFDASYDCENPGSGNVPNSGDCVKTFGWGVVQVNSRGKPDDCFRLQQRDALRQPNPASDRAVPAVVPLNFAHIWATHATIDGPVAIDGLYLPVPESVQSNLDDWNSTIQIGQPIPIAVGPYRLASIALNTVVGDPDPRTGLVPLKANIGLNSNNQSIGALPIGGTVDVNLSTATTADGFNISKVKLHVKLPPPFPSLPVDAYLQSDNETGAHINGFQIGPFDTDLLPGFSLKSVFFKYIGGTDEVWTGGANIGLSVGAETNLPSGPDTGLALPGINFSPPPPDLGIGFRHGQLDHFGLGVNFPPALQPPLFPGITLSNAHFAFGLVPAFRFTGGIGIAIGQLIGADGDVFVAFAGSQPYHFPNDVATGDLSPLAGRWLDTFTIAIGGDFHLMIPAAGDIPLLNAWLIYEAPDYFEVGSHFDFKVTLLELKGDAGGWILPSQGKFSLGGSLSLCLNVHVLGFDIGSPCLGNGVVVSSRGFGGCATVLVPTPIPFAPAVPVTISAGYTWDGGFEVTPFSCDLSDFTEANPRAAADRAGPTGRAAQAGWGFNVNPGAPSAEVRVTGQGEAPAITLTGPGGETFSTAQPPTDPHRALIMQYGNTTLIAVNHPARGRWTVTQNSGPAPVTSVAYAKGLPDPNIRAKVSGHGRSRTLAYHLTAAAGRTITFVERGARTYHILGVAHGSHGRIRFSPAPGRAGRRQIVAVVTDHGIQSQSLIVARYAAPGPKRPARPRHLRVSHHGYTLNVSWTPVAGATMYEVLVEAADGGRETAIVHDHRARIVGIEPGLRGNVLVDGVSVEGRRGSTASRRFSRSPIAPPTRPKPPKHERKPHR
jgi:ELWxxDGT repeat protein